MPIGPLLGADDACGAVEQTLRTWLPTTFDEIAAVKGVRPDDPATWEQLPDETASTSAEYPDVIVSSPGLAADPERHGDGTFDAIWDVIVTFQLRQTDYATTAQHTRLYATGIRTAVLQHIAEQPNVSGVEWTGEAYSRARDQQARTFAIGHVAFTVRLAEVLNLELRAATVPESGLNPDPYVVADTPITIAREA